MRFVALLRGVNVGKARRVPMADWTRLLTQLGLTEVRTLLNSGNAVFTCTDRRRPATLATDIRNPLQAALGLEVPVVVKRAPDFRALVEDMPWKESLPPDGSESSRVLVAFAQEKEDLRHLEGVAGRLAAGERWCLGGQAGYLWCPSGLLDSPAGEALLSLTGRAGGVITTRNWATTLKIDDLLASATGRRP